MDSRFRGNDRRFEMDRMPNDTSTATDNCLTRPDLWVKLTYLKQVKYNAGEL